MGKTKKGGKMGKIAGLKKINALLQFFLLRASVVVVSVVSRVVRNTGGSGQFGFHAMQS